MKITKVAYGFTKPTGYYSNNKLMIEIELNDTDDEMKALRLAKETADKFFNECNPNLDAVTLEETLPTQQSTKTQAKKTIEEQYLFLIQNAGSINELKMYEKLADNDKYLSLKESYNTRLKELID